MTSSNFRLDPVLKNAYSVYFSEAHQHLKELKGVFEGNEDPSSETLKQASTRFHTLKGGAGFFGLSDVSKVAGFLEKKIIEPDFSYQQSITEVKERFLELQKLIEGMPKPEIQ